VYGQTHHALQIHDKCIQNCNSSFGIVLRQTSTDIRLTLSMTPKLPLQMLLGACSSLGLCRASKVLKSLEFDWTKFKALNFTK